MLDYFLSETISMGIATAALDQPGDEGALMAEPSQIGNDEQWSRNMMVLAGGSARQGHPAAFTRALSVAKLF